MHMLRILEIIGYVHGEPVPVVGDGVAVVVMHGESAGFVKRDLIVAYDVPNTVLVDAFERCVVVPQVPKLRAVAGIMILGDAVPVLFHERLHRADHLVQVGSAHHVAVHHAAAACFQSDGVQPPVEGVQQLVHHAVVVEVAVASGRLIVLVEHVEEQVIRMAAGRLTVRQQSIQLTVFYYQSCGVECTHFRLLSCGNGDSAVSILPAPVSKGHRRLAVPVHGL